MINAANAQNLTIKTEEEIREYLNENSSNKSRLIYRFVHEIKKGDYVCINMLTCQFSIKAR